jgi:hypothetical protein
MLSIEGYQRTMFDPVPMEDIGGEDKDMLSERDPLHAFSQNTEIM